MLSCRVKADAGTRPPFGVRRQSEAATALWIAMRTIQSGVALRLPPHSKWLALMLVVPALLAITACRRDMQDQPKMIAYRENTFYKDGTGSRPLVEGTVPRGFLREDRELYFGKKASAPLGLLMPGATPAPNSSAATQPFADDVDTFPFPITKEDLNRGEERYNIYCSVCHGMTGNGDGMVARRGFNRPSPANYHQDRLRQAPVGHFFDVMTNGWGAMPSYASQVSVEDRWRIIAYVRALQLSQMPPASASTPSPTPTPAAREVAPHR